MDVMRDWIDFTCNTYTVTPKLGTNKSKKHLEFTSDFKLHSDLTEHLKFCPWMLFWRHGGQVVSTLPVFNQVYTAVL